MEEEGDVDNDSDIEDVEIDEIGVDAMELGDGRGSNFLVFSLITNNYEGYS
jgi:hypothetical protein